MSRSFKLKKIVVLVTLLALGLTHLNCTAKLEADEKIVALVTQAHGLG